MRKESYTLSSESSNSNDYKELRALVETLAIAYYETSRTDKFMDDVWNRIFEQIDKMDRSNK
jgi:hypothetical protein